MSDYEQLRKLLQEKEQCIQEMQKLLDGLQIIYDLYEEVNKTFDLNEMMERTILFLKKKLSVSYAAIYCLEDEKLVLKTSPYLIPGLCHELDYKSNADSLENVSFHRLLGDWMLTVPIFSHDALLGIIACCNQVIGEKKGDVEADFWLNVGYFLGSLMEKGILYKKALTEGKKRDAGFTCGENSRLLLVDDNELNRKIVSYMLEAGGYVMDEACDGEMALEMVEKRKYAMILMDLQMPKKDGYTAVTEIRAKGFTMPIIALSAYDGSMEKQKAYDCGCNDYLVKPLNKDELFDKISLFSGLSVQKQEGVADFKVLQQEFLDNIKKSIDEVDAAFSSQDQEKIKFIGHKWKGTGKMFEYPEISEIGLELENLDIMSDLASWSSLKKRLEKYLPVQFNFR